jgi:predicted transcriptional regulator
MAVRKPKKPKKPKPGLTDDSPLTKAEEFYIQNNLDKTDKELAEDLGKPADLVRQHIHITQTLGRVGKLLVRDKKKGYCVMTQGASEASDESRRTYVSEAAIQQAAARGDYEEAHRLQQQLKQQRQQQDDDIRTRNSDHIHYIDGPPRK